MNSVIYIAIRDDGQTGDGSRGNPYNGSTDIMLDNVLASVSAYTVIIFGPGMFQTKGFGSQGGIWTLKDGLKLTGSGMNSTTLQLVGAVPPSGGAANVAIISSGLGETNVDIEISDMTLDVNLARQPEARDRNWWGRRLTSEAAISLFVECE